MEGKEKIIIIIIILGIAVMGLTNIRNKPLVVSLNKGPDLYKYEYRGPIPHNFDADAYREKHPEDDVEIFVYGGERGIEVSSNRLPDSEFFKKWKWKSN